MDAFGMVPKLILLHIVLQVSSSAETLTLPTLSVTPKYQKYYEGDDIRLICSTFWNRTVMRNLMVQGYRFFQEDGSRSFKQIHQVAPVAYGNGTMDFQAQRNDTGNYSCAYWLEEAGREVQSDQSHIASIQINEAPSAPSLNSTDLGKSVLLKCSAPPEANDVRQFHFISDRSIILVMLSNSTYTYNLTDKDVEIIRCAYVQYLHGRHVVSKSSNPIFIDSSVNIGIRWVRLLAVGGSFFTINGLIFLISYCISLRNRSLLKTETTT